jgi:hypothetical protein
MYEPSELPNFDVLLAAARDLKPSA